MHSFAVLLFDQSEELVVFFNGCKDLPANVLISGMLIENNRLIQRHDHESTLIQ